MIDLAKRCIDFCINIGVSPKDSERVRLKKATLTLVPLIIGPAAFIWGLIYIYLDHYLPASIPISYSFISAVNLWQLYKTKDTKQLQKIQMILVLFLPFFLMWSLGGFALGSFVMIWAFFAPIAALTYETKKRALRWFHAFMALVVVSVIIDQALIANHTTMMPQVAIELFFLLNISVGLSGVYFLIQYFISQKDRYASNRLQIEHEKLILKTDELKVANEKLKHRADYDELTGLPNRYRLQEDLIKMMGHAKRHEEILALLFIDLDGFKNVNDSYGHAMGDEVLVSVAKRIKLLLRQEDTVARIGGDEFAVGIGDLNDLIYVENVAQRIIIEISKEYEGLPPSIIGASIGVSLFPKHAKDIDSLLSCADKAMYEVKHTSKNDFMIYSEKIEN